MINWFATLRLNLQLLPFRQAVRLPVVVQGPMRLEIGSDAKIVLPEGVGFRTVTLGSRHETYKASAGKGQFSIFGTWNVGGDVHIGVDSCLFIHAGATLSTGAGVYIARDSQIECAGMVMIGNRVLAGELYLCDTSAHQVMHASTLQPMTKPIEIADDCYFGFRTMVLRGSRIPPHCVIGSGAVCTRDFTKEYPKGHLLLTGAPAMVKTTDVTPNCRL